MPKPQRFMEASAVARELGFSTTWLHRLVHAGRIVPDGQTDAGTRLYTAETVAKAKKELSRDK